MMTVLVAIDFSKNSFKTVEKGLAFAEKNGSELHILHVIEKPWYVLDEAFKTIQKNLWEKLETRFPTLQKKCFHCLEGNFIRELAETAENIHASLLVIGYSKENYPFKEFFVGSTTKNILRNASVPVLVIKNDLPLTPQRILIPTDFSENSATTIRETALWFPDSEIILLHAYVLPFERRLKSYGFNEDDIADYHAMIKGDEDEKSEAFIASLQLREDQIQVMMRKEPLSPDFFLDLSTLYRIDLIALHTSGFFSFFAFDLLEEADRDVLVFTF